MANWYHISLWSYYPDDGTKGKKKGDYLGGVSRVTCKEDLDQAIESARELWTEWAKKYSGSMIEIYIYLDATPHIGKMNSLFHKDNFEHFKPKEKETPF